MTIYDDNIELGNGLRDAFASQDRTALQSVITDDVVWMLPGDNAASGDVTGITGIVERFAVLASFGVDIRIEHVLTNQHGPAFILHNTGHQGGRTLDEHLVTVIEVRDGRAARLETFVSDIPMMNAYFA
jgi:ketosteroid isomerase-like protein